MRKAGLIATFGVATLAFSTLPLQSQTATPAKTTSSVLFFDDFDRPTVDVTKWVLGIHQFGGPNNNGVVPQNLHIARITDPETGKAIGVLDVQAHGDLYKGAVPGVQRVFNGFEMGSPLSFATPGSYKDGFIRTGGVVWTKLRFGPAKYEIRMRALQKPGGETAIWNFYEPSEQDPGSGTYTEIDIEMPANGTKGDMSMAGLNSYTTEAGAVPSEATMRCNCMPTKVPNQADGKFHTYEIDWYDGSDGSQPRVVWYMDGVLSQTSTRVIPIDPAQLWIGNWPAQWSAEGSWDYNTQHQYVDWVKISKLEGDHYPAEPLPAPIDVTIAAKSSSTVDLAWRELTESRDVAGFRVMANGVLVDETPSTHIELTGLNAGDEYSFTIEAVSTSMVASAASQPVSVQLPKSPGLCVSNPTSPITALKATLAKDSSKSAELKWDVPVDGTHDGTLGGGGCTITGYEITRSDGQTRVLRSGHKYTDTQLRSGRYRYTVAPFNQYGIGPGTSVTVVVP